MDGKNFFRSSVTPPPIPEFAFDLQRFTTWILSAGTNGNYVLTNKDNSSNTTSNSNLTSLLADTSLAAGDIVSLNASLSTDQSVTIQSDKSLKFQLGKKWTYTGTDAAINIANGGNLSMSGGTIVASGQGATGINVESGATLTTSSGTVSLSGNNSNAVKSSGTVSVGGGTLMGIGSGVEINGGSFTMSGGTVKNADAGIALQINGEISNSKITDGTIGDTTNDTVALELTATASGTVDIYGGTFSTKNGTAVKKDSSSTATVNISETKEDGTTDATTRFNGSFDGVEAPSYSYNLNGTKTYFASQSKAESTLASQVAFITRNGEDIYFNSLSTAFDSAQNGETVKLAKGGTLTGVFQRPTISGKSVTLDINGQEATFNGAYFTVNSGGKLNIIDSSNSGKINVKGNMSQFVTTNAGGEVTIDSGNIECAGSVAVVSVFGKDAKVTVNGGTLKTTNSFVLASNGSASNAGSEIVVNGGTLKSDKAPAIYAPAIDGKLEINGGEIEGSSGVEIRAGELTVTGGTITGTGTSYSSTPNDNGSTSSGAGIAISQHTTKKEVSVNISGYNTQISGANALAVSNPQDNTSGGTTGEVSATISGGTLKSTATATSGNSQNGNAILADNANVNITVLDGNLDGNVTVTKASNATANTTDTTVKMEGGTTTGKVQVIETTTNESGETTETTKTDEAAKEALQVTGGTYTDTVSANNYTDEDTEISSDGTAVNKGAGWSLRSGQTTIYDYLISAGGSAATLLTATFGSAPSDTAAALKFDAKNKLLGVASSATYAWSTTDSISSLQGNYALAKFTTSGNAVTIEPQSISTAEGQTYRGVKISGTDFIGNATALTATLAGGLSASVYGVNVDATDNKLTNITGGDGNDNLLAGDRNTTLDGGNGDNVLQGGTGNDSLKGGTGSDVFYYTAGNDTVNGFGTGDIVRTTLSAVTDGSKLTTVTDGFKLTFSNKNSLTFTGATVPVSLSDGSIQYTYTEDLIKQGNGATLGANASSFDGTADSLKSVVTIDGSAVTGDLSITDNTGSNYIVAGKGKNTFNLSGGNDTIVGYDSEDTVSLSGLTPPTSFDSISYDNSDYVLNFDDSNSLTFKTTANVTLKSGSDNYYYNALKSIAKNEEAITLGPSYTSNFNAASTSYETIDASKASKAIRITGNDKNNYLVASSLYGGTLLGGDGADSLVAGSIGAFLNGQDGADSLVGGSGNDTFAYTGGDDKIVNYTAGQDLVSVAAGVDVAGMSVATNSSGENTNLVLNFDTGNSLTFDLVLNFDTGNSLTFEDLTGTVSLRSGRHDYQIAAESIVSDNSITLTAGFTEGSFAGEDKYDTINASLVGKAISIEGNNNGNYIVGSASYASSLKGGTGNDTFLGGTGDDVFFYDGGKDVIQNFDKGSDSLSITSDNITKARATSRRLTFTMQDKGTLVFRSDDDSIPTKVSLTSGGYLTKDGVVKADKSLTLFSSAKGKIDLGDDLYKDADITTVSAASVKSQSVTLVGGTGGGSFSFYKENKKRDGFEYNGGAVTISNYESGKDRINLGSASISGFSVNGNDVLISLNSDANSYISLTSAKGSEVLIHQSTSKGNSYQKMVFADNGVMYDKKKATSATLSTGAVSFDASNSTVPSTLKKITLGEGVKNISITAGDKNMVIDASLAGAGISLVSGAKNDKFIGSSKSDMFVYNAGKDIIQDFNIGGETDQISLSGSNAGNLSSAKITAGKKSVKFKFGTKDVLTVKPTKGSTLSSSLTVNGESQTFGKNSIAKDTNVSLTSQFGGTYNIEKINKSTSSSYNYVDGELVSKKLTFKGTTAAESLIGGSGKTLFKGGGGADSLVGGAGADTFFYAKGDKDTVTIANFDFSKDKLKIAGGTIAKNGITSLESGGVQFAMKKDKGTDAAAVGWFDVKSFTKDNVAVTDASKVAIKANNTYYWFAKSEFTEPVTIGGESSTVTIDAGELITWSDKKVSKSDISDYSVIELNYATNLVKASVATAVSSTLDGAKLK